MESIERRMTDGPVEPTVRIRSLNHWFGRGENKKQVLYDVKLDLVPGEIVIMTGPSGSGKTTLLTLVGGLRSVQEGSAAVMGEDLSKLDTAGMVRLRRRIGFIFQAHNLFNSLTACQNVRMSLELHDHSAAERERMAVDVLGRVGLGKRIHYKPQSLSGGQRQRVAIARAIVNRPKLILADEPTAALDKDSGRDVVDILQGLAREELCTILLVTHDNRILDAADRIVNMVDGSIVSNVAVKQSIEICEFLSKCPVFLNNPPATLTEIAQQMTIEKYAAGSIIMRQGDVGDKFYILRNGKLDVLVRKDGGEEQVAILQRGEFFGEIALLESRERTATVRAAEGSEVYALAKPDFLLALERSEPFRKQLLDVFFKRQ